MRAEIEEAVQLMQRGDDASVEQALALLQNTVFSFSMRVCGQREDAEDTMQEVLLKSVPQLPKFQKRLPLTPPDDFGANETSMLALCPAAKLTGTDIPLKLNPTPLTVT
jgi:hypothetical protein